MVLVPVRTSAKYKLIPARITKSFAADKRAGLFYMKIQ